MKYQKISIFYSYAKEDKEWQEKLKKYLSRPRENTIIEDLHRDLPLAGLEWENEIQEYLKRAQIILLLISPDFLAPGHYDSSEVRCIKELKSGKAEVSQIEVNKIPHIIPIIVRPNSGLENTPFSGLGVLPSDKKAISVLEDEEKALQEVAAEIERVIEAFSPPADDLWDNLGRGEEEAKRAYKPYLKMPPEIHNQFFTGREKLLNELRNKLAQQKTTALTQPQQKVIGQAISGLGGIGKTQMAMEYVYRYRKDYRYIFWVNADTREKLISEYVKIAQDLGLAEQKNEQDQMLVVAAIIRWLETNTNWLLVLDNADDLDMVQKEFIPREINGHLLLTTRASALGLIAERIEIEQMDINEGMLLLLRRAKTILANEQLSVANSVDLVDARKIVQVLGGLPLALDQAGAYIERTKCGLANYFQLYQDQGSVFLTDRKSVTHPESVVTTFLLAFEKVKQADPVAADLLQLCAFLAADTIPENLLAAYLRGFIASARNAVPLHPQKNTNRNPFVRLLPIRSKQPLPSSIENREISPTQIMDSLNKASEVLLNFSLIRRDQPSTFAVHRLVQAVLRDSMDESIQIEWAEHAVRVVSDIFPLAEVNAWPDCEKLLSQVLICATLIAKYQITIPEASQLLNNAGFYLAQRAQYREAEPLYQLALAIRERTTGEKDPSLAQSLHNLAELYERQGDYSKAEQLLKRALKLRKRLVGENHPDTATSLNNLAELYRKQNNYKDAETLYEQALEINQKVLRPQHPATSLNLNNLATLYLEQGKYLEAEYLYNQALEISRKELGEDDPHTAAILHDLAELYRRQGKMEKAEKLHNQVMETRKRILGEDHPDVATSLSSLAALYGSQKRMEKAEEYYKQALSIRENKLGPDHPDASACMSSLARLYKEQNRIKEAEQYYKQALLSRENKLGLNHPSTIENQKALAHLYESQGRFGEAERLYKRTLANRYRNLRVNDSSIMQNLRDLAELYERQGKTEELEQLYKRAFEISVQKLGVDHPSTAQHLHDLLQLYEKQDKVEETELLYERLFKLRLQQLKGSDPSSKKNFIQVIEKLVEIYKNYGKSEQVEHIYGQALKICYEKLGADDPLTIECLDDLMKIYEEHGKIKQMEHLYEQEVEMRTRFLQKDDSSTMNRILQIQQNLAKLYTDEGEVERAEQMYEQGLLTSYQKLGLDHPHTIQSRYELAKLYESHHKPGEAERIHREALEISKKKLEPGNPHIIDSYNDLISCYLSHKNSVKKAEPFVEEVSRLCEPMLLMEQSLPKDYMLTIAHSLANRALFYHKKYMDKRKREEAALWFEQALKISKEILGKFHQDTVDVRKRYVTLLKDMGRDYEAAAIEIDAITMEEANNNYDWNEQLPNSNDTYVYRNQNMSQKLLTGPHDENF